MSPFADAITVRAAAGADAAAVAELFAQLDGADPTGASAWIELMVGSEHHSVVAEHGGAVAGVLTMSRFPMPDDNRWVARVSVLVVDDATRGMGCGAALMGWAERQAAAWDCDRLELTSMLRPGREATHRFYTGLGFVDTREEKVLYVKRPPFDGTVKT